jgi:hypothetical protein
MNIFTLYFNGMHVLSIVFAIASVLAGIFILKNRYHIIYATMISLLMTQLGNFSYESIWKYFMNQSFDAILLYVDVVVAIAIVIFITNLKLKYININKYTFILLFLFIINILFLWQTGWFYSVKTWIELGSPDPHNLLWATSKLLGFLVPISVLKNKNVKKV